MGLWVSHDCWSGAYSAFTRWRNRLCQEAGYEFEPDGRSRVDPEHELYNVQPVLDWEQASGDRILGRGWGKTIPVNPAGEPDVLLILIMHSDCDGWIRRKHQLLLADRLEGLAMRMDPDEGGGGHIGSYRDKTMQFVKGLRDAHAAGEHVEFG